MRSENEIIDRTLIYNTLVDAWIKKEVPSLSQALKDLGMREVPDTDEECMLMIVSCYRTLQWVLR